MNEKTELNRTNLFRFSDSELYNVYMCPVYIRLQETLDDQFRLPFRVQTSEEKNHFSLSPPPFQITYVNRRRSY